LFGRVLCSFGYKPEQQTGEVFEVEDFAREGGASIMWHIDGNKKNN
jgi:hypothetical protein